MDNIYNYDEIINKIGEEKFEKLKEYLDIICPKENVRKYFNELDKMWDYPMSTWEEINNELIKKYKIVLLKDVLYNKIEWLKFERWYYNQKRKTKKKLGR